MAISLTALLLESTLGAFAAGLRPEPDVSVSEWAEQYRIVGKPSPEPGPWRTSRVPYVRAIMDDLSPSSPVEIVALMKAAQGAGTECGLNAVGCWMHRYPDSCLIVQPTTKTAKHFVRTRLDRLIDSCPVLREIVAAPRSRDASNTITLKEYGPGRDTLAIVGANSGVDLRSYPSRYAWMDEVDGYPMDLDHEGDPTELVIQRTAAFRRRKIFMLSTPTLEQVSLIYRWYQRGDQRKFHVPCPLCDHFQPLIWYAGKDQVGGLRWPKGQPDQVRYQCQRCGDMFEEWRKVDLLQRGEWWPTEPSMGGGKIHSYQINALYYPYGWPENAWTNLAAKWEADHRDPLKRKTFINLKLGEPYKDPAEAKADADALMARRESYGPELPLAVAVLTAGVDVQANRLEAELVGWGKDEESWSIEYRVFPGDTSKLAGSADHPSPWEQLEAWLLSEVCNEAGLALSIRACCIDARYNREAVRKFCAERWGRRIWAIVGQEGQRPVWPTKAKRQRGILPPPFTVGVDAAKESVYARLKVMEPGPSYCHFPSGRDRDYFEMLTAEIRVPDYTGPVPKFQWRKKTAGARNEALDTRVYAYAALVGLAMQKGMRLNEEAERIRQQIHALAAPKPTAVPAPEKTKSSDWLGGRGNNWL